MKHNKSIKEFLLGRPLRSDELGHEKLSVFWGLPILASDAVSSVAYAIEEVLLVLVPVLSLVAFRFVPTVVAPIILLLSILVFSYMQIIQHYPSGGGAYAVSLDSFGHKPAMLAASALIIDYVLTVAVSVSSSTEALVSALPALDPFRLPICIACIVLITLLNLRGISESAKIFGVPTYLFIFLMALLIIVGFVRMLTGSLAAPAPAPLQTGAQNAVSSVSLFLLLRAFSSGCSALTGVEAVSNAVPSFRSPSTVTARRVLLLLACVIIFIFGGTSLLATRLQVLPIAGETVLSQMARAIFGQGPLYYALQGFTAIILLLAANTAYSGLPTLLAILARDSYVPRQFSQRGAKLSFSNGILFICVAASVMVILFGAETHRLIPLYSVGVFVSFTLSQAGMFIKWHKAKEPGWQYKSLINGVGALVTLIGGVIVLVTKFAHGAWILILLISALMFLMSRIQRHYQRIAQEITPEEFARICHPSTTQGDALMLVLMTGRLTRSAAKSLNYASQVSRNVRVLSVVEDEAQRQELQKTWASLHIEPQLVVLLAPFRDVLIPIRDYVLQLESSLPHGNKLTVVMTRFIEEHWYDRALHNQTSFFLQRKLGNLRNVATVLIPYYYMESRGARADANQK
ncbi:MAG: APC family permease [Christensenellaceae bacterium]|jgi:amino acid transporter|nr:APC family permease [Christensenellaceae bacterium]